MTIGVPESSDATAVARVHLDTWRETYGALLPESFFDEAAFERLQQRWNRWLDAPRPSVTIRVAELEGRIVGFAMATRPDTGPAELHMIYLLAVFHGSGLGQALLDAAVSDLPALLWMAADNPRALAFYRRNGFEPTGEHRLDENFDNLAEIRLIRPGR